MNVKIENVKKKARGLLSKAFNSNTVNTLKGKKGPAAAIGAGLAIVFAGAAVASGVGIITAPLVSVVLFAAASGSFVMGSRSYAREYARKKGLAA